MARWLGGAGRLRAGGPGVADEDDLDVLAAALRARAGHQRRRPSGHLVMVLELAA
jgi:hypothetical protein